MALNDDLELEAEKRDWCVTEKSITQRDGGMKGIVYVQGVIA